MMNEFAAEPGQSASDDEPTLQSPSDVARQLNISYSTLRRWSTEFADFLSEWAGRPELSERGEPVHRRYTESDVAVLRSIGELLRRGLTYREVGGQLNRLRKGRGQAGDGDQGNELTIVPSRTEAGAVLSTSFSFLNNAMERVVEGQQFILSSQQANRDLMGIVIQDNFNLKEENARLRERMGDLEKEISELRRQAQALREEMVQRLSDIEARDKAAAPTTTSELPSPPPGCLTRLFRLLF